ncbi:MAG: hypothetical protein V6Z81_05875 [Parvularculales bacterium]
MALHTLPQLALIFQKNHTLSPELIEKNMSEFHLNTTDTLLFATGYGTLYGAAYGATHPAANGT